MGGERNVSMPAYCFAVTVPLRLILQIAQETFLLLMVMAVLFICALFLLASLILLHAGVQRVVKRIHPKVARLKGSGQNVLNSEGAMLHLPWHH